MKLFFSGAQTFQGDQPDSALSLGGFISDTLVENGVLNGLFDSVSQNALYSLAGSNKTEYRIIVLLNDGTIDLTSLTVYIEELIDDASDVLDQPYCTFTLGYAPVTADNCSNLLTQKLPTARSRPFGINMVETSSASPLPLPDLAVGNYLGICIGRTIVTPPELTDDQYQAILVKTLSQTQVEEWNLVISSPNLP